MLFARSANESIARCIPMPMRNSCAGRIEPKLADECESLYRFLADPYPDGDNPYLARIEANVAPAARVATN